MLRTTKILYCCLTSSSKTSSETKHANNKQITPYFKYGKYENTPIEIQLLEMDMKEIGENYKVKRIYEGPFLTKHQKDLQYIHVMGIFNSEINLQPLLTMDQGTSIAYPTLTKNCNLTVSAEQIVLLVKISPKSCYLEGGNKFDHEAILNSCKENANDKIVYIDKLGIKALCELPNYKENSVLQQFLTSEDAYIKFTNGEFSIVNSELKAKYSP